MSEREGKLSPPSSSPSSSWAASCLFTDRWCFESHIFTSPIGQFCISPSHLLLAG